MPRKKDNNKNENEKETNIFFYKKRKKTKKELKPSLCCSFKLYNLRRDNDLGSYFNFDKFPKNVLICRKCVFSYFEVNVVANIIYMRHGARAPKKKIKNIWPFVEDKGDLTFLGFEQSIRIGKYLRKYYYSLNKLNKKYNKKYRHIRNDKVFKFFKWNKEHQIKEMINDFICVKKKMNTTERPLFVDDQTRENSLLLNYINHLYFHKKHLIKKKLKNYDIKKKKRTYDMFIKVINKYLSIRTTDSERCKLTAYAIICGILGINKNIYMSFFLLKYINKIDFFQNSWKIFKIFNEETFNNCLHNDIWNTWRNKNKEGLEKCLIKNHHFIISDNTEETIKFDCKLCYYKKKCRYTKMIERYDLFMYIINYINFYVNIFFYFIKILYILYSIVKVAERDTIMLATLKSTNNYIKMLKNFIFENSDIYKVLNNYYKSEIAIVYYLTKWKSNYICRFSLLLNNKYNNYSNKGKAKKMGHKPFQIVQNEKDNKIDIIHNKIFTILKKWNSTMYILKKKINKSIILNDLKKINYSSDYIKNYLHLPILANLKNENMNVHKIKPRQINSISYRCNENDKMELYNYKYHIFKRKQKSVKIIKQFVSSYDAYLYHNINIIFDIKKGYEKFSSQSNNVCNLANNDLKSKKINCNKMLASTSPLTIHNSNSINKNNESTILTIDNNKEVNDFYDSPLFLKVCENHKLNKYCRNCSASFITSNSQIDFQSFVQKKKEKKKKIFFQKIYECYKWISKFEYNNRYLSWLCSGLPLIDVVINFLISVRLFERLEKKKYTPKIILYLTHQSAILSFQSCIGIKKKYMKIPPFAGFISLELIHIKTKTLNNDQIILHSNFPDSYHKNNILNFICNNNIINIFCCKKDCVWKKKIYMASKKRKRIREIKKNTKLDNYKNIFKVQGNKIQDFKKLFFLLCKENTDINHMIQFYDECLKNNYKNIRSSNLKNYDNIKGKEKKRNFHGFFVKFTFNNFSPLKLEKKSIFTKKSSNINGNQIMKDIHDSNQNDILSPEKFTYLENAPKNNYNKYRKLNKIIKILQNDHANLESPHDKYMDYVYNSNSGIYRNIYSKLNKAHSQKVTAKKSIHFDNKIVSQKYKRRQNKNNLKAKSKNKYWSQYNYFKSRYKFVKKRNVLISQNFKIRQSHKFYIFQNKNVDSADQNDGVTGYRFKDPRKKGALKMFNKWIKKKHYKNKTNTQYVNDNIICLDCLVTYLKKMIRVYGNPEMV
ncbi:conserved Plasmodium protein, unknown function [Plasmodium vinckei vinckei]|uniref:Uncharacterized protein n=1 Tax=Plasmodium vinckei vinckei TaxID=54757 RepID=A0A081I9U6_PLAVN|nr:conserved Plasmodium protein, unknown function [Plasmodium vinckei vinckei]KEG00454.1 hypothetical protein YYE_04638 [Plasmodium vinckei vinckei]VEV54793.1 conserved Plasmodium protein, unknown function [Plasmodium vinckei vinckei]